MKPLEWLYSKLAQRINYLTKTYINSDEKILNSVHIFDKGLEVYTPYGYVPITDVHKTKVFDEYEIKTIDNHTLKCADNHFIYRRDPITKQDEITYIKDIRVGDRIVVKRGSTIVSSIRKTNKRKNMYDLTVLSKDHTYYTNDILSHNTTTIVSIMAYFLCFSENKNIAVMANKNATSKEIVDKLINVFTELPYFLKPGCINFGATFIKLDNNCRIIANSTSKSTSIGFTIDFLYLDEFAHVPSNVGYEFWRSVYPTIASLKTSRCVITSTPNGTTNKFYDIWEGSIKGTNTFHRKKVEWWKVPGRDEKWAEAMKADFGVDEFAQEFDLKFNVNSSSLLKSSDFQFMHKIEKTYISHDFLDIPKQYSEKLLWSPDFDPYDITDRDYFILSVDTAEGDDVQIKSNLDPDYNVITIFKVVPISDNTLYRYNPNGISDIREAFRLQQIGVYSDREVNEEGCALVARFLTFDLFKCGYGNVDNVRLLIEMNFNGRNFINIFKDNPRYYQSIIFSTYHKKPIPGERNVKKLGYKTTPGNRDYVLKNGGDRIAKKYIIIDQQHRDDNLSSITQLENFSKVKGKYQGLGIHDDISMTILSLSRLWEPDFDEYKTFLEDYTDYHLTQNMRDRINILVEKGNAYIEDNNVALNRMNNAMMSFNNQSQPQLPNYGSFQNQGTSYPSYPSTPMTYPNQPNRDLIGYGNFGGRNNENGLSGYGNLL